MIRFVFIALRCWGIGWHRWDGGQVWTECMDCGTTRRIK